MIRFCTTRITRSFFTQHSSLLKSVHGENIWNADEILSSSSKKYKVLLNTRDAFVVTSINKHEQHIKGMHCFNAIGQRLDQFINLLSIECLPNELTNMKSFFAF